MAPILLFSFLLVLVVVSKRLKLLVVVGFNSKLSKCKAVKLARK